MSTDPPSADQPTPLNLESKLSTESSPSEPGSQPYNRAPYRSDSGQYRIKDSSAYIPAVAFVVVLGIGATYVAVKSGMRYYRTHYSPAPIAQERKAK